MRYSLPHTATRHATPRNDARPTRHQPTARPHATSPLALAASHFNSLELPTLSGYQPTARSTRLLSLATARSTATSRRSTVDSSFDTPLSFVTPFPSSLPFPFSHHGFQGRQRSRHRHRPGHYVQLRGCDAQQQGGDYRQRPGKPHAALLRRIHGDRATGGRGSQEPGCDGASLLHTHSCTGARTADTGAKWCSHPVRPVRCFALCRILATLSSTPSASSAVSMATRPCRTT